MNQPQPFALKAIEELDDQYLPTPQIQEFLLAITRSYTITHACSLAGLNLTVVLDYLNPQAKTYKPGLLKLYDRAKSICYGRHIETLNRSKDWKAHAFWLERHEESFAPKEKGASITNQVVVNPEKPTIKMDPDTIKALSEAYDKRMGKDKA